MRTTHVFVGIVLLLGSCTTEDTPECIAAFDEYVERVQREREVCQNLEPLLMELRRLDEGRADALRRGYDSGTLGIISSRHGYLPHQIASIQACNDVARDLKNTMGEARYKCEPR